MVSYRNVNWGNVRGRELSLDRRFAGRKVLVYEVYGLKAPRDPWRIVWEVPQDTGRDFVAAMGRSKSLKAAVKYFCDFSPTSIIEAFCDGKRQTLRIQALASSLRYSANLGGARVYKKI